VIRLLHDKRIPLVSATGSCKMGYRVGEVVAQAPGPVHSRTRRQQRDHRHVGSRSGHGHARDPFRRGGHGRSALHLTRRIIVQNGIKEELTDRLVKAYANITIGDPLEGRHADGSDDRHRGGQDMHQRDRAR
jgi:aldehyde dehydrogenase (NAD+)